MKIKKSAGEWVFDSVNVILLLVVAFITLFPFYYVIIASISNPDMVSQGKVVWYPIGFELTSYQKVFAMDNIWTSYANTIFYSGVGTFVALLATMLSAYPLSKRRLKGRGWITMIMLITMWFNAGMMPTYLNFRNLGLLDNRWALIIGFMMSAFYVVLMRTYFESISESLEESAKMDGASDWLVLFRIFIPLSVPAIMTIGLYYFVDKWNAYFWAMILLKDETKIPLQVLLKKLVVQMTVQVESGDIDNTMFNDQTIIYATIVVAAVPMLALYPFVQKFFTKGIMLGAVKG